VLDNLNTHGPGSLSDVFEPAEARRLELVCKPGMLVNCRDDNPAESPR
jgi:hypothetical protein